MYGFHWGLPGLDKDYFVAIMNLVAIRNGAHDMQDAEMLPNKEKEYQHTTKLRTAFLDRLAEAISRRKNDASHVAATAMHESGNSVVLYVAINDEFGPTDKKFFFDLQNVLGRLNAEGSTNELTVCLRDLVFNHYRPRILRYAKDLHKSLRKLPHPRVVVNNILALKQSSALGCDAGLRDTVFKAYELRGSEAEVKEVLFHNLSADDHPVIVWEKLRWMGQFQVIYKTLLKAATSLPCFNHTTIVPVSIGKSAEWETFTSKLTLSETLERLGHSLDPQTISEYILGSKSISDIKFTLVQERFRTQLKERPRVHAEIKLALYLLQHGLVGSTPMYIGCSRRSCYMCHEFLHLHGMFTTRGCHGWFFPRWTIPCIPQLSSKAANKIARTILQIQKDLEKEMTLPVPMKLGKGSKYQCDLSSLGDTLASASLDSLDSDNFIEVCQDSSSSLVHQFNSDSGIGFGYWFWKGLSFWRQMLKSSRERLDNPVYS